jgi:hypothetical protein
VVVLRTLEAGPLAHGDGPIDRAGEPVSKAAGMRCIPFAAVRREDGMSEHTHEHKQVVFRYNGNDENADVEVDILGDLPDYQVGEIVARKGKSWKVVQVLVEHSTVSAGNVPIHIVCVSEAP